MLDINTINDRLIELVAVDEIAAEIGLKALKTESGVGITALRKQLADMKKVVAEDEDERRVTGIVEQLNEDWFFLKLPNSNRICTMGDQGLRMLSKPDFSAEVCNADPSSKDDPATTWLHAPDRREYCGIFCDPYGPPERDGKLNTWSGWGVEAKQGDVSRFLDMAHDVLGDPKVVEYYLNWAAWTVQNPTKPTGTAIMLTGKQGCGKSTFFWVLRKMFGKHGHLCVGPDELFQKHAEWQASCMFVMGDEIVFKGDARGADKLKGKINGDLLTVEPKGVDRFTIENMLTFGLSSNHDHAVKVEFSDRRYMIAEVTDKHEQDATYWGPFYAWLNTEGLSCLLHYLQKRDVSGWHAEADRPMTEAYIRNIKASLQDVHLWWSRMIRKRSVTSLGAMAKNNFRAKADVYAKYVEWSEKERRFDEPTEQGEFWKQMRQMGAVEDEKRGTDNVRRVKMHNWDAAEANFNKFVAGAPSDKAA